MKGYYQNMEKTKESINKGWLSTGDIGRMDKQGYFTIVDRKRDKIDINGRTVYPNEIEDYVSYHPKVLELAVVGIPNEVTGEAVKAFVVKKDPTLTKEEVIAYCREGLAKYKVPSFVQFIKEVPKSNVGKLLRRILREMERNSMKGSL